MSTKSTKSHSNNAQQTGSKMKTESVSAKVPKVPGSIPAGKKLNSLAGVVGGKVTANKFLKSIKSGVQNGVEAAVKAGKGHRRSHSRG